MACNEKYSEAISLNAAGALGADEAEALERHALECPECAADLAQAAEAVRAMRGTDVPLPTEAQWRGMEEKLWASIKEEPSRAVQRPRIYKLIAALGAAAAVIIAAAVLWNALAGTPVEKPGGTTQTGVQQPGTGGQSADAGSSAAPDVRETIAENRREALRTAAGKGYLHACLAALNMQKEGVTRVVADSWSPMNPDKHESE